MAAAEKTKQTNSSRRAFLFKGLATFAMANTAVYAVGVLSKSLDGSIVAGAKSCGYEQGWGSASTGCDSTWYSTGSTCSGGPSWSGPCGYLSIACSCW